MIKKGKVVLKILIFISFFFMHNSFAKPLEIKLCRHCVSNLLSTAHTKVQQKNEVPNPTSQKDAKSYESN